MNQKVLNLVTVITSGFAGSVLLSWWLLHNPAKDFVVHTPGMDGRPKILANRQDTVAIGAYFARFDGTPANLPGNWPRFRGADFDNIGKENTKLLDNWGTNG
ncbi:MAG: hypothetical protein L0Y73_05380, partial [Candidatus Aminicenantes bacterium]|nr:hypothetical protein [Candidatus Aminicenantes bacterium]